MRMIVVVVIVVLGHGTSLIPSRPVWQSAPREIVIQSSHPRGRKPHHAEPAG
jgi:hypothetical protein